ncbi:hypothetical protein [Robertkochia solimangrovi]|uniref:hypothetical protein n=1 Tax=Robertkochia solimangrovi TaxID=2213046 RepID=UPI00117F349E|nr:hypothetical protein [Robertkochia solimangrovi]TRZ43594.1 hypothetical protein DMZ48_09235 [Robertkochia solimangrovi]
MKKNLLTTQILILSCLFLSSCGGDFPSDTSLLQGYWEIESVEFPDGGHKDYQISTTIDQFVFESDSTGYRQKVQPRLDGTYTGSGDHEQFTILKRDRQLILHFTGLMSEHEEKLLSLNNDQLILLNEQNKKYIYQRYEPIDIK